MTLSCESVSGPGACLTVGNAVITFVALPCAMISFASNTNPGCLCVRMHNLFNFAGEQNQHGPHSVLLSFERKSHDFILLAGVCPDKLIPGSFSQDRGWETQCKTQMHLE